MAAAREPATELRPWDRQPGESEVAYQGFVAYRDSGVPRNLASAARGLRKHEAQLYRWKDRHQWDSRLLAYDSAQTRTAEEVGRQEGERKRRHWGQATDHLMQAVLSWLLSFVVLDPETGRRMLDPRAGVKSNMLIANYLLRVQTWLAEGPESGATPQDVDAELRRMATEELERLKRAASPDRPQKETKSIGTAKQKRPRPKRNSR
jgi:hypothetical protein